MYNQSSCWLFHYPIVRQEIARILKLKTKSMHKNGAGKDSFAVIFLLPVNDTISMSVALLMYSLMWECICILAHFQNCCSSASVFRNCYNEFNISDIYSGRYSNLNFAHHIVIHRLIFWEKTESLHQYP